MSARDVLKETGGRRTRKRSREWGPLHSPRNIGGMGALCPRCRSRWMNKWCPQCRACMACCAAIRKEQEQ